MNTQLMDVNHSADGQNQAVFLALANLAKVWMRNACVPPGIAARVTKSFLAGCVWHDIKAPEELSRPDAVQRAFLAAGCDLVETLALSPEGRQALRDLGFEPVSKDAETEGQ